MSTFEAVPSGLIESAAMVEVSRGWEFDAVYRREYPGLIAVAAALTGDRDGAQDLVQDTMVKAFIRWDRVCHLDRPGAWCHHVLVNACRSRLRRRATEWRYLSRLRRSEPTSPEPSADTVAFWTVVRTLPSRPRALELDGTRSPIISLRISSSTPTAQRSVNCCNHSSGIPDDYPVLEGHLRRDPLRVWSPAEMFELIPTGRGTAGSSYEYSGANYSLLGLMIEHLQGRPVAEVLRDGVLAIDNVERLVFQPDEEPTEPMAMPPGVASADLQAVGGYLPSLASVSAFPFAGGMASDAPSLAALVQGVVRR